ncbi:MAG: hypothetical protein V3U45_04350 [bacterium]
MALVVTLPLTVANPGLDVKVGNFVRQPGTGNQGITGVGFQPKVLILFSTNGTSEGFSPHADLSWGWATSPTERYSIGLSAPDANATGGGKSRFVNDKVLTIIQGLNPEISAEADLVSFDADGFTLNWVTNEGTQNTIHYVALGGTDLANAKAGDFASNMTAGPQSVTGVGFQPDIVLFMANRKDTFPGTEGKPILDLGAAVSSTERWAVAQSLGGKVTKVDEAGGFQRTNQSLIVMKKPTQIEGAYDYISSDPDGFTVDVLNPPTKALKISYLALAGANLNVGLGSFNQPTATGPQSISVGFRPVGVLLTSWNRPTNSAGQADGKLSIGAASDIGAGSIWGGGLDDPPTDSKADSDTNTTKSIRLADPGVTPALAADAELQSFDAGGFTLDWTTVDATAREVLYWAFGGVSASACDAITVTTSDPAGQLWFNETVEPDGLPLTTQLNVSASFQTGPTPALSVTNDGSTTCDITIRLTSDPGTGRSLKFNTTNNAPWPEDASKEVPLDPSSVTACSSVAPGGTCDIWLWADYENALGGQTLADVRVETI